MRRLALLVLLACLALAAPASAHGLGGDHQDWRGALASTDVAGTVDTVDRAAGTDGEGLPLTWCGDERTTDDVTHAVYGPSVQQFKLVYAYASDAPSRFAAWKDALQADVSLIGRFMGAQSGGRKTPRFDMGTSCGPRFADIQVVALPNTRAYYANSLTRVRADVLAQVPFAAGQPRNVLVLADRMSSSPAGHWSGVGQSWNTEAKGDANPHNSGRLMSVLWVPDAEDAPGADPDGWWPEGLLHELTHNLGAVGPNAPHATLAGHCTDGYDVMCYDDGSLTTPLTYSCPRIADAGVMRQIYDCGGDDYFNVAPPSGSYLATSFNVYDNRFLAGCVEAAPACGGTVVPGSNPQPPVSTSSPAVTGDARVGSVLIAVPGDWANAPTGYAYQWEQGDGGTWLAVPGATGPTYEAVPDDAGLRLRVRVIATNTDGSTAAYSAPSAVVRDTAVAPAAAPSRGRVALRVVRGRGRGKRIGTIAFAVAGGRLRSAPARVKLVRGRYRLQLCSTAAGSRCARRTLKVTRAKAARLPALSLAVPGGATGRVTYTVRATRGIFSALTAKRPSAGLLLGP